VVYAGLFPVWIAFFFIGMFLRTHNRNYNIALPIAITALGLIFQLIEHKYWLEQGSQGLGIKLSSFIFSFGAILLLFSKTCENFYLNHLQRFKLDRIGTISFGIYLIHLYVLVVINKIATMDSWLLSWLLTITASVAVIKLSQKAFPTFSKKFLGFR
jgi:peptidoglycan/LPS O-acetylase OafA/YrhL